jgi:hypothetical protein
MSESFTSVETNQELRQGDIIKQNPNRKNKRAQWGFVLTADCDIAQKKSGTNYSWLEIIPAMEYLENIWCEEQLRKFSAKYSTYCLDKINSIIRKNHQKLSELSHSNLCEWLLEKSASEILNLIYPKDKKIEEKLESTLKGIELSIRPPKKNRLHTLCQCWEIVGIDKKTQESRIREYLNSSDGFPDFFVVPEIPGEDDFCFIILLRSISTPKSNLIFNSELEEKIVGQKNSFHRIGRFNDNLRYAVVQKFSFLFSRIGMPTPFEKVSGEAADILIEKIFPKEIR